MCAAVSAARATNGQVMVAGWRDAGLPVSNDLGDASYAAQKARRDSDGDTAHPNLHPHRRQGTDRAGRRRARAQGKRPPGSLRHHGRAQLDRRHRAHLRAANIAKDSATTTIGTRKCCGGSRTSCSTSVANSRPRPMPSTKMHGWARARSSSSKQEMDRMQKELEPLKSFTLPGRRQAQRLPASGAHRMPARRARLLGAQARGRRSGNDDLSQPTQRPSVRAIAMGREAARRARVSVGSWAANRLRPSRRRAQRKACQSVKVEAPNPERRMEIVRWRTDKIYLRQAQIGPMANFVYLDRRPRDA